MWKKILLDLRNPVKSRHLDSIKRERLGVIFQREILEIMEQSSELTNYRISISKVAVPPSFSEISVFWLARGDGTDEETGKVLESFGSSMRAKLSEKCGFIKIPVVKFVMDDKDLREQKLERLFREADYGVPYRTISNTAEIIGAVNVNDPASKPRDYRTRDGKKKLPWLQNSKRRKLPQKESEEADLL
ncbi:unnamed protein product [Enterobius vermicularis]|uniref:Ribosome-binding factor A n=1 Tax=Enterobius vermicularis TaxID=51028 RepID=A0A0N4VC92_ENTVE|nr:unnamed protein product [Enterobius vermicularis]